ncbi:helix-turn-helix transcriptional regulator [Nocardiopsis lucentensis]|uniref:helix-turn-helix transcriptional regulator n=1 Tax=Nocardiopsis lucentensis TaxID=53441 RepID=UPI00034B488A|nr:helix-turn-helix domain-containing protein [Nocardiopsis lucentensis]
MDHASLDAAHALADPVRRRLYEYVAASDGDVSRGRAAEALGLQRTLAAHHLDRLVDAGLLEVTRRKVSGREGPGSGRPANLPRRSGRELSLHLPPRDYELAARVLAEAVDRHGAEDALHAAARAEGKRVGAEGGDTPLPEFLRERGYEPEDAEDGLRLRNCPFHSLAREFPPLACGLNLELLRGALEARGEDGGRARMSPVPGRCCVVVSKNNED